MANRTVGGSDGARKWITRSALAWSVAALCSTLVTACGSDDLSAPTAAQHNAAQCVSLNGQTVGGIQITATKRTEASGTVPAYCKVSATGAHGSTLDIEVDLPDNYANRLFHQGGGGFDGVIPTIESVNLAYPLTRPLQRGMAFTASNGGNRDGNPVDFVNNTTQKQDYSYAALGTTVHFAKAVITAFYGQAPRYTYFEGASNGGRNAYLVAQDWPADYDGIIAGAETMNMATQTMAWLNMASKVGTPAMPSNAQWTAAYQAALQQCGNANGVILNPDACTYDAAPLQCGTAGAPAATCLTPAQLQTVRQEIGALDTSSATLLYSGYYWADFGSALGVGAYATLGGGFAGIATGNGNWLLPATSAGSLQASFNVDSAYPVIAAGLQSAGADHSLQAIAQYLASGKKLISFHGGADPLLSARDHLRNWLTMTQLAGASASNARFYREAGVGHVTGGNGPDQFDYIGPMIAWVEQGVAPGQLTMTRLDTKGNVTATLPDCPYPTVPHYNGAGNINDAGSYSCANS
ncbi:MAG TPA: tannase/feruloyl esterase family alpha/beta hydrolase [Paraburkholderia sp.]|jgi:feruloyl esterase|nr:tannase/feruloyl esterase family alpha/beta hydrolase [Paraburkholderia sp.]